MQSENNKYSQRIGEEERRYRRSICKIEYERQRTAEYERRGRIVGEVGCRQREKKISPKSQYHLLKIKGERFHFESLFKCSSNRYLLQARRA